MAAGPRLLTEELLGQSEETPKKYRHFAGFAADCWHLWAVVDDFRVWMAFLRDFPGIAGSCGRSLGFVDDFGFCWARLWGLGWFCWVTITPFSVQKGR